MRISLIQPLPDPRLYETILTIKTREMVGKMAVIDEEGYRENVGIILTNHRRCLFLGKRIGQNAWQFPQGGILQGEKPEQALYRELQEEIGLLVDDVELLAESKQWLSYKLPQSLVRHDCQPLCIGQKQKWFLLRIKSDDERIDLSHAEEPEFDEWRWVSYWYPLRKVVDFKKRVYRRVLEEFALTLFD